MATRTLHDRRFPGETDEYRQARDEVLATEIELRRATEAVAASRRRLPLGGPVPEDYVFEEGQDSRPVRLSELFASGQDTLVLYSFMYGPDMAEACPMCTSMLDSLDGAAPHVRQRVGFAVVARSPMPRVLAHAEQRGWRNLRLVSSAHNSYNRDYFGETETGTQIPMLNVFVERDGAIRHFWASELFFAPADTGQDLRHVDAIWPLWHVLDLTPGGRDGPADVEFPSLRYPDG
jgi:predicted dithiol-disulfide oxidoreductase (DUF899 family)